MFLLMPPNACNGPQMVLKGQIHAPFVHILCAHELESISIIILVIVIIIIITINIIIIVSAHQTLESLNDSCSGACEVRGSDRAGSPPCLAKGQGGSSAPAQAGLKRPAAAAAAQISQLSPQGPPHTYRTYPLPASGRYFALATLGLAQLHWLSMLQSCCFAKFKSL